MSQQIFNQWSPVVKAHDENNQEAYIPFAGIHAQTRDGKDEVIVGAGNMVFDPVSELWLPVTKENRLPVEATLTGQNVQPVVVPIRETPLAAGEVFTAPLVDLTTPPGIGRVGYVVACDQPLTLTWVFGDGVTTPIVSDTNAKGRVTIYPGTADTVQVVPPFAPMGRTMRLHLRNRTQRNMTVCRVYELRYTGGDFHPQNLRAVLAHQAEIRDTALHSPFTTGDEKWMWEVVRTQFGGGKLPIYINNVCNQQATVEVVISISGVVAAVLGTIQVPAASTYVVTNQDFAGLDVPSEVLQVRVRYNVAPTSGAFSAYADLLVGASA